MPDRFEELKTDFQALYQNQDYEAALNLASKFSQNFPERLPLITYWRISSAARAGKPNLAMHILEEMIDSGFWYGDILLRDNPALEPLEDLPAFERLVRRNQQVKDQDQSNLFPILMVRPQGACQGDGEECPLLVGLHSNASTARDSLDFWSPAGTRGWLVAAPQSSQAIWKDAYVWDDLEFARREIELHLSRLDEQYAIEADLVVLAGHDMGAETALWMALNSPEEFTGFIALALNGPLSEDLVNWRRLVAGYEARVQQGFQGLRGYFVLGKEDQVSPRQNVHELVDLLSKAGIPSKLQEIEGVGHSYTSAYDSALLSGLEYISGLLE